MPGTVTPQDADDKDSIALVGKRKETRIKAADDLRPPKQGIVVMPTFK